MKTFIRRGAVLYRILRAAVLLFALLYLACLAYTVWVAAAPADSFRMGAQGDTARVCFDRSPVQFAAVMPGLSASAARDISPKTAHLAMLAETLAVSLPLAFCQLWLVFRVLSSIVSGGSPFTFQNVRRIRMLGFAVVGGAVLPKAVRCLIYALLSGQAGSVPLGEVVTPLAAGLLLLVLAQVFEYGCALQRAQDETV